MEGACAGVDALPLLAAPPPEAGPQPAPSALGSDGQALRARLSGRLKLSAARAGGSLPARARVALAGLAPGVDAGGGFLFTGESGWPGAGLGVVQAGRFSSVPGLQPSHAQAL